MRDHDEGRAAFNAGGKRQQVAAFQLLCSLVQNRRAVVVIGDGAPIAGEVLEAGGDAAVLKGAQRHGDHRCAKLRLGAERTAADHVVRSAAAHVRDRRKVHVEAQPRQHVGNGTHGVIKCRRVARRAVGRHIPDVLPAERRV